MNLRQLINSSARVTTLHGKSYKNFTECDIGNVISINTRQHIDRRLGLIHMLMYITATPKKSPVTTYRRSAKTDNLYGVQRNNVSTYTVAMSFSDYWELNLTMEEVTGIKLPEDTEDDDILHSEEFKKSITKWEQDEYLHKLIKEAEKKTGRKLNTDTGKKREVNRLLRSKTEEDQRMDFLAIKLKDYISRQAHGAEELEWQSGTSKGSKEVQHQYVCQRLYTKGYAFDVSGNNIRVYTPLTVDNRVRVNCTCSQFYFTYAWYNADRQVLIGQKPPAYVKARKKNLIRLRYDSNRLKKDEKKPPYATEETIRNMSKLPGMCKHLQFMVSYLMNQGVLEPLNSTVAKNIYKGEDSLATIKNVVKNSVQSNTLGNEKEMAQAQKDFKKYLSDVGKLSQQIKWFEDKTGAQDE